MAIAVSFEGIGDRVCVCEVRSLFEVEIGDQILWMLMGRSLFDLRE
ncbi:hypothetical protein [Pseudanabaena sp. Chao 1811]|nr:hypothetical protein [Pseudanabaena sp. Chao 1811]